MSLFVPLMCLDGIVSSVCYFVIVFSECVGNFVCVRVACIFYCFCIGFVCIVSIVCIEEHRWLWDSWWLGYFSIATFRVSRSHCLHSEFVASQNYQYMMNLKFNIWIKFNDMTSFMAGKTMWLNWIFIEVSPLECGSIMKHFEYIYANFLFIHNTSSIQSLCVYSRNIIGISTLPSS